MADEIIVTAYGPISASFTAAPLGGLCVAKAGVQTGPFGSQLHASDYVENGTPIITVEHLADNRIIHENIPRVSDEDKERLAKYALKTGDIVFSRVGSVDRRAIVRSAEDGWLFSGRCLRIRPDPAKIDPGYLSWFLGLPEFKEHIRQIAVGATMPSLNTALLSKTVIYYPQSLTEQQAIACILGALDDKIELNRQMNRTLEAMARAMFKSWFVDFEPVRAKADSRQPAGLAGHIADLFPDSFGETNYGPIPSGWRLLPLGDVCEFAYGKALKGPDRNPGRVAVMGSNGQIGWHDSALVKGPGVVIGRKGNPGTVNWVQGDFFPIDTTFYLVPKMRHVPLSYLKEIMSHLDLSRLSADSAVPGLNRNIAYMSLILVPPAAVLAVFDRQVTPLAHRINQSDEQSLTLTSIRDTLLARLISGELRVLDAERIVERTL